MSPLDLILYAVFGVGVLVTTLSAIGGTLWLCLFLAGHLIKALGYWAKFLEVLALWREQKNLDEGDTL